MPLQPRVCVTVLGLLVLVPSLWAQPAPAPTPNGVAAGRQYPARIYEARRISGEVPVIDGRLDDAAWGQGEWSGDFRQQLPTENADPSQATEVKILYDDTRVYVAIRAHDAMDKLHRYAGRRDAFVGDVVGINFDSYFDKRTGFEFNLTAAGSQIDLIAMNDGFDTSWDAVWQGKTALEKTAWTAEFGIPLSQLRYGPQREQVWGLHVWRWIDRLQEEDQWQLIPRKNTGFLFNFGELHGIRDLPRFRHLELLAHTLGRLKSEPRTSGDPFASRTTFGSAGLDAKIGLSTDFTLDATVNPDFGQVESDPSVINLSAYETFYGEKRPFFVEGTNIMSANAGGDDAMLYYSRRIGRPPSDSPALADDEFLRSPEATSILGAVKVTGKTRTGLSIGVLESVTAAEEGTIRSLGGERAEPLEPAASYTVLRAQQDWDKGNMVIGGIVTSAQRWTGAPTLAADATDAWTGGIDFLRYFRSRRYLVEAKLVGSRVSGDPAAILDLQQDPVHYFQRPDADHLRLDGTRTSLSGHGGSLRVERRGNSKWRLAEQLRWASPGLDLNALGYLRQADSITSSAEIEYEETKPRGIFRSYEIHASRWDNWDMGGRRAEGQTALELEAQFRNKWGVALAARAVQAPVETRLLRGGPALRRTPFVCSSFYGHMDQSKRVYAGLNLHRHFHRQSPSDQIDVSPELSLRVSNALSLSTSLQHSLNTDSEQYVATLEPRDAGTQYLLGRIHQKTLALTLRASLQLSPVLSLQYYGSPFVSVGRFSDFKVVKDPQAEDDAARFTPLGSDQIAYDPLANSYTVAPTASAIAGTSFENPDFSFRQFRSNLVLRWEYRPGSALYVVWSQGRTDDGARWERSLGENARELWRARATNVLLFKLTYWFSS